MEISQFVLEINEFVLEHIFHRIETEDGPAWWRECIDPEGGYIVVWQGNHLHTYHYPPNFLGE